MCRDDTEQAFTCILATLRSFVARVVSLTPALKPSSSIASQIALVCVSCDLKVTCIASSISAHALLIAMKPVRMKMVEICRTSALLLSNATDAAVTPGILSRALWTAAEQEPHVMPPILSCKHAYILQAEIECSNGGSAAFRSLRACAAHAYMTTFAGLDACQFLSRK